MYAHRYLPAVPGDNVKIKLSGIDDWEQIESGFMLCPVQKPMPFTMTFIAQVRLPAELRQLTGSHLGAVLQVKILDYKSIICPGFTCVLHVHSIVEDVTITVSYAANLPVLAGVL